ncbi:hypothetical protein TH53_06865 [Pedobacter lusitanus]|uniref:Glycosyl transferase family 51 domain-containing protein n=1 Tax=Pedobacter lusitanus TaxID=1503925 RepID=A0A0D0GKZ4_9SPHI|nr:biosynthetic peptidoglycan transglycosylase [Pedobacter lusitanus]KIO77852.1 hypothetical protein TH53_06865 [Pedobacter lusitanus]
MIIDKRKILLIKELLLILFICRFFKKTNYINQIRKRCKHISEILGYSFQIGFLHLSWNGEFNAKGIVIAKAGLSLEIGGMEGLILFNKVLKRKPALGSLKISHMVFKIQKTPYDRKPEDDRKSSGANQKMGYKYYKTMYRLIDLLFLYFPKEMVIDDLVISIFYREKYYCCQCKQFLLKNGEYNISISDPLRGHLYKLEGALDQLTRKVTLNEIVYSEHFDGFLFTNREKRAKVKFRDIKMTFSFKDLKSIDFIVKIDNPIIYDQDNSVTQLSSFEVKIACKLTNEAFQIVSSSFAKLDDLKLSINMNHSFLDGILKLSLSVRDTGINALHNLPFFTFSKLAELKMTGMVSFELDFAMMTTNFWQHSFHLKINSERLSLVSSTPKWADLTQEFIPLINANKAGSERNLSADHFVALTTLPKLLIDTIVCSEDSHFYNHWGFDNIAFGYSVIQNIKAGKFIRGGSTITMQLARNLFLNHHKNIFRKLEEIWFSYLIENVFVISKDRILELYLNIIEFAPGIYGIRKAIDYYFSKNQDELTLQDCLILSYIIPRPKFFLAAFENSSEQLRRNLKKHIDDMVVRMQQQGYIDQETALNVNHVVSVRGMSFSLA